MTLDFFVNSLDNIHVTATSIPVPTDWPKTFFDRGFVDVFDRLGKFRDSKQEIRNLITLLGMRPGQDVLDVPCGFGRHTVHLAAFGMNVTGLDASPDLLNIARQNCPEALFVLADMRCPPEGPFDHILNLWSSFGYYPHKEEDTAALVAWHRILKPGGRLLMELTDLERAAWENRMGREPISHKRHYSNGVLEEAEFNWHLQRATNRYSLGTWSRVCSSRLYSRDELQDLLRSVGFQNIQAFGDLSGGAKRPCDRLVLVTERA